MGPGAEGNLSTPPITCFPLPPLGGPQVGHWPICKYLKGEGEGWDYNCFCLIRTGRGIMSYFLPFPERGRDTMIALLYWPPPLSVITSSSLPSSVWINSGQSCMYAASSVIESNSPVTDLSIQKCAVLMYSDEKLLFYDLFIKSLIENFLFCGCFCLPSDRTT